MNGLIMKLAEAPWSRLVLVGVLFAVLYWVALFDGGESLAPAFQAAADQKMEQERLLKETKTAMDDAKRYEQEAKLSQAQFQALIRCMPVDLKIADLLQSLSAQASAAGAEILKIEPKSKGIRRDFYESMPVDLELEGNYSQLVLFLSNLSKIPRLVTFEQIGLTTTKPDAEAPKINLKGTMLVYRFVPEALAEVKTRLEQEAGGTPTQTQ